MTRKRMNLYVGIGVVIFSISVLAVILFAVTSIEMEVFRDKVEQRLIAMEYKIKLAWNEYINENDKPSAEEAVNVIQDVVASSYFKIYMSKDSASYYKESNDVCGVGVPVFYDNNKEVLFDTMHLARVYEHDENGRTTRTIPISLIDYMTEEEISSLYESEKFMFDATYYTKNDRTVIVRILNGDHFYYEANDTMNTDNLRDGYIDLLDATNLNQYQKAHKIDYINYLLENDLLHGRSYKSENADGTYDVKFYDCYKKGYYENKGYFCRPSVVRMKVWNESMGKYETILFPYVFIVYHPTLHVFSDIIFCYPYVIGVITVFLVLIGIMTFVAVNRLYTKNEQLKMAQSKFTSGVAHDMKTPLAIIRNMCECVMEDVNPDKNIEYVQSVHEEAGRMNEEIKSFLSYNRLLNYSEIDKNSLNFSTIVKEQLQICSELPRAGKLNITTDIEDVVLINGNKKMLEMAIANLLTNAIKYTDEGGNIYISVNQYEKNCSFEVLNDCAYFDKCDIKSIWNVMDRNDESRNRDENSSGMGLPITAEICKLHKIKCGAEYVNKPTKTINKGALFFMEWK